MQYEKVVTHFDYISLSIQYTCGIVPACVVCVAVCVCAGAFTTVARCVRACVGGGVVGLLCVCVCAV